MRKKKAPAEKLDTDKVSTEIPKTKPSIEIEETEINFLNAKSKIPGKVKITLGDIGMSMLGECKPVNPKTQPMGMGELGESTTIFSRKFRWTLGGKYLPKDFMKKVSFDYFNKKITFEYYDIKTPKSSFAGLNWAWIFNAGEDGEKLRDEVLRFITFDGCGNPLYAITFSGLIMDSHTSDFEYASSDEATQKIAIRYLHADLCTESDKIVLD